MMILSPKGTNLDQKVLIMGSARFFPDNLNFLKVDHKVSFCNKNQQNSMNRLEDISKNVDFVLKRGKFGPKWAKNKRGWIFPEP